MTASRTPRILLLGATALITLFLVAGTAVAILAELSEDTRVSSRPLGDVKTLDLSSDDGDVEVRVAAPGTPASLQVVEEHGLFGGPDVDVATDGGQITASSDCTVWVFGDHCGVKWIVRIPRGTPVKVRTGSGDVALLGVTGEADIQTGSGDIEIDGASGAALLARTGSGDIEVAGGRVARFDAKTGSGDVELSGMAADELVLEAASGDIGLRADRAPRRLIAETGSGDIEIAVPDARYDVATDTGSGDEDVQVVQDPDAPNRMQLETGSGDVTVRRR